MAAIYYGLVALGAALMLPLAAIGCGIGEGMIFAAAVQGMARQPEAEGRIRNFMLLCFALVEALYFITLAFFFMMKGLLPSGSAAAIAAQLGGH